MGKTTVAWEVAAQLRAAEISHAIIEGDFMAQVYRPPPHDPHLSAIAERNLTAIWANYTRLGYHRLIYTNTLSTLPDTAPTFHRDMGANVSHHPSPPHRHRHHHPRTPDRPGTGLRTGQGTGEQRPQGPPPGGAHNRRHATSGHRRTPCRGHRPRRGDGDRLDLR